mgnify:CR=1 FL=1
MNYTDFWIRIGIALFCSFAVGLERQWRRRAIGLRTNVLVCVGAFMFSTLDVIKGNGELRTAAQVVTGIGFLGAGVILKDGINVKGLNTAATLWCNAAIGVLTAFGLLLEAVTGTILILMSNIVLRFLTKKLMQKNSKTQNETYSLNIVANHEKDLVLRTMITQSVIDGEMILNSLNANKNNDKIEINANISINPNSHEIDYLVTRFTMEPDVYYVNYNKVAEIIDDDEN